METEEHDTSPVTNACQQLTEGLMALTARDNVPPTTESTAAMAPATVASTFSTTQSMPPFVGAPVVPPQPAIAVSSMLAGQPMYDVGVMPAHPMLTAIGSPFVMQHQQPLNPVILNNSG